MEKQQIKIFDTTLRDGQQCPGAGMSVEKNIEYAHLAAHVGVDVLEAGFPSASRTEFEIVNTIAKELSSKKNSPIIAGLCQLRERQIDLTIDALLPAIPKKKARLHTYLPVDPELMIASLGDYANNQTQIVEDIYQLVKKAADTGLEVEFTPEGYSRMRHNFDFVTDVIRAAISAGATIINCPDTIGGACKLQGKDYFVEKMNLHAEIMAREFKDRMIAWSVHCHNDFGLALDNSMNGVLFGPATQIEGCFNGVGERAGNVALEQCIMYIKHFGNQENKLFYTNINTQALQSISDFVNAHMLLRQPHWPLVGGNAAKHSSGGHTNAVIKNPRSYQPFDPKEVGSEISLLFGPSSGGNHAKLIIEKYGYRCHEHEKAEIAQFIKEYYVDRRKGITDEELLQAYFIYRTPIKASGFDYAKVGNANTLKIVGEFFDHQAPFIVNYQGNDSALAALHKAICEFVEGITVETYNSQSRGEGVNSKSESTIVISDQGKQLFTGLGEDSDLEISALKALIDAVNQAYICRNYKR